MKILNLKLKYYYLSFRSTFHFNCTRFFFFDETCVLKKVEKVHIFQVLCFVAVFIYFLALFFLLISKIVWKVLLQLIKPIFQHPFIPLLGNIAGRFFVEGSVHLGKLGICAIIVHFEHFVWKDVHCMLLTLVLHKAWNDTIWVLVSWCILVNKNIIVVPLVSTWMLICFNQVQFRIFHSHLLFIDFVLSTE